MAKATEHNVQWKTVKFDQFFDMLPTNTLSRDKLNNQRGEYQNIHYGDVLIKYPYCLDCNVNDIPYINEGVRFNTAQVKNGDVIFADTAEDDTVGKCVEVLNVGGRKIVSGLHTYFCRPKHEMAPGYLGYFLNSNHFHNQLLPYIAGSKVSSVNRTSIARTFILYPESLPAQRRIAAILSSADKVIASTQKVIAKYKQMKQGMMEDLLKPKEGWKMVRLGECCEINPKTDTTKVQDYDVVAFIRMEDVSNDGFITSFSERAYKSLQKKGFTVFQNDDVIFAKITPCMENGKGGLVRNMKSKICMGSTEFHVLRACANVSTDFIYQLTISKRFRQKAEMQMTGSAGQQRVPAAFLEDYFISIPFKNGVPDLAEQRRIAAILSGIDAKIAAEETVLEKYEKVKKGMMERLLNEKNE